MYAASRANICTIRFLLTFNFRLNRIGSLYPRFIFYSRCTEAPDELRDSEDD